MRKVSENKEFPFLSTSLCYYELINNELVNLDRDEELLQKAYERCKNNNSKLYVSWHGMHRTDMFEIDDLPSFARAFHFEKAEHEHDIEWHISNIDAGNGYVYVDIEFKCGCTFDGSDGIRRMYKDLLEQKGWEMVVSHIGGYDGRYTIKVKKRTMKE